MINLKRLFKNLLDDEKISIGELTNFSSDGIERLRANNPGGIFTTILTDTEAKHDAFEDAQGSLDTDQAEREGRTIDMNIVMAAFTKKVRQVEGLISWTYKEKPGIYEEFYPLGLTEYNRMTVEGAEMLITRFVKAVNKHNADLPVSVVTDFNKVLKDVENSRKEQLKEKGEVGGSADAVRTTKRELGIQWTYNVFTIAREFIDQPQKADVYINQKLLNDAAGQPFELSSGSVDGNSIAVIEFDSELVDNKTPVTLRNQSPDATFEFYFAQSAGDEPGTLKALLNPESETIITAAEIGFDSDNRTLLVKNLDPVAADWEVEIPE